jgi:hypothetical protein
MAQTLQKRRPATTYGPDELEVQQTKEFNKEVRLVEGYRSVVSAGGLVPITVQLKSPGKRLLGVAIIPVASSDISDASGTFIVNNFNLLADVALENLNPGFVQGMIFYPTPQPLSGTDTIKMNIQNDSAAPITVRLNVYYVARSKPN